MERDGTRRPMRVVHDRFFNLEVYDTFRDPMSALNPMSETETECKLRANRGEMLRNVEVSSMKKRPNLYQTYTGEGAKPPTNRPQTAPREATKWGLMLRVPARELLPAGDHKLEAVLSPIG